jgi:hypothetical protein
MTKITSSLDLSCSRGHFEGLYHACQLGRHTHLPFTTSSSRAEQAFDLVIVIYGPLLYSVFLVINTIW